MTPELAVIPCGAAKRPGNHPARQLYTGSYFRAGLRWAIAIRADRILILSAKHGLVELDQRLDTYDLTFGQPGAVTVDDVAAQARQFGLLDATPVVCAGGKRYRGIVRKIWPHATSPVDGLPSMGAHLSHLTRAARRAEAGNRLSAKDAS